MRHRRQTRKLGVKTAHRIAMLRNMVSSLLEHGRIVTTVPRGKELRKVADKMISLAKDGGLHARRQALSVIRRRELVDRLFNYWGQQFVNKNGGYSRLVPIGQRRGDAAMLAIVELATDSLKRPKSTSPRPLRDKKKAVSKEATSTSRPSDVDTKEASVSEPGSDLQAAV
ncbi:MAG: 50S ribosomal protein L17 [Dissulfurimicrobium hydrothermale]|uniref:50S ribosomal protein L17 n=1 Tax=Dissulfurimicrobium hydrothermale TaxID=1750598 RepID=UPI003C746382